MGDDRPSVYVEDDGLVVYRASATGYCLDALLALRQGIDPTLPPEWFREKLDEGTMAEPHIVNAAVRWVGGELVKTQEEVEIPVMPGVVIRGHTDGRIRLEEVVEFGVEAKKLGPTLWGDWEKGMNRFFHRYPYYTSQLTLYMAATGLPFLYAAAEWDPDEKAIIKVEIREVDNPPGDINEIKARVLEVEARFAAGEMPTCDGKAMWPCPVYFLHNGSSAEREEVSGGDGAELLEWAERYEASRQLESAAKKDKDVAAGMLVKLMADRPDSVTIGEGEYTLTKYEHVSSRLDNKALEQDGIDLSVYRVQSKTPKVKVTRNGGEK